MAVAEQALPGQAAVPTRARSPWQDATRQLLNNPAALISGIFLILLALISIFAEVLNPYVLQGYGDALGTSPPFAYQVLQDNYADVGAESQGINIEGFTYYLGADNLGRDILTRTMYGARVSLAVALIASVVSLIIGVVYGLIAGFVGGWVDNLMMRIVDFLYGLPIIIVVILLQVYFKAVARNATEGSNPFTAFILDINASLGGLLFVFVAIGALNWIGMARIARGQTLSYKEQEFIEAAQATGVKPHRILSRHLLPNIMGPCIVAETLAIPGYILLEAFLSFIGLGVDAPTPSWGIMIQEGYQALRSAPHVLFGPAIALTLTVLAFNFLGDGLRDVFDPRLRGE